MPVALIAAYLAAETLRPPAVPLITCNPNFSIWSGADKATDDVTRHWTRHPNPLVSLVRVDGETYRILGKTPDDVPALPQTSLEVTATKTTYTFKNGKVKVSLSFLAPALPHNLEVFARPVNYVTWQTQSIDGAKHNVQLYFSASGLATVNDSKSKVQWKRSQMGSLTALQIGSASQNYLRPAGDDTRVDWGYLYSAANASEAKTGISSGALLQYAFTKTGAITTAIDGNMPRPANQDGAVLATTFALGNVGKSPVERHLMLGYDEIYSIEYYGKKLKPYWRRNGASPTQLFEQAELDYDKLKLQSQKFDQELYADAKKVGGDPYAKIVTLSYRECVAANGLAADGNGQPLYFTKENTSNGDIATVDVIYPMAPIWLLLSPTLMKASLVSNFMYAASPRWKFPNAPHDLGTYPQVTGRDDGGEGMPVEESGNMILMVDALAQIEGNASFASRYWPQLTQWAKYLEKYGLDPENQLCTDDFMGHLAHNANLSVKAILALAAYGDLCKMRGDAAGAKRYAKIAHDDAVHWMKVANEGDDASHSVLAFDKPNTWSQKYNLVWDQILHLNVFPMWLRDQEVIYYKTKMLRYGLPLDSRTKLTKTDWSIWSATLATNQEDFQSIVNPILDYINTTTTRDPIADSYITDNPRSGGMHARPVVGGFFIKMLDDKAMWKKWARGDTFTLGKYASLPKPPVITEVVPTGRSQAVAWKFTTDRPGAGWMNSAFDDTGWRSGSAPFGTGGTPGIAPRTTWDTGDIWMRRTVKLPSSLAGLQIVQYHDEDLEVYIDGVLAASEGGYVTDYGVLPISKLVKLKPGATVTLAVHCHQTGGGQGVDVGLGTVR